jgi:hypothetical protein
MEGRWVFQMHLLPPLPGLPSQTEFFSKLVQVFNFDLRQDSLILSGIAYIPSGRKSATRIKKMLKSISDSNIPKEFPKVKKNSGEIIFGNGDIFIVQRAK